MYVYIKQKEKRKYSERVSQRRGEEIKVRVKRENRERIKKKDVYIYSEYGYVPFSTKLKKRKYVKWKEHLHRMDTRKNP